MSLTRLAALSLLLHVPAPRCLTAHVDASAHAQRPRVLSGPAERDAPPQAPTVARADTTTVDVTEASDLLAVPSPDGRRIAFLVLGQPWLVDRDGGRATPVLRDAAEPTEYYGFAWSPDSRRLASWFWEGDPRRRGLSILDLETGTAFTIPESRDLLGYAWHGGKALLFATAVRDSTHIWRLAIADSSIVRLTTAAVTARHVAFSGDGARAALAVVAGPPATRGLHELDLASGAHRVLAADTGAPARPAYSPRGERIAFLSTRDGSRRPWIVDRDGIVTALDGPGGDVYDAPLGWTPDGDSVLVTAAGAIHLVPTSGGAARVIEFVATHRVARRTGLGRPELPVPGDTMSARGIVGPTLSPDGRRVVFAALGDLWVASIAGGTPRRLTQTPAEPEVAPRWSRNGARIAYFAYAAGRGARLAIIDSGGTGAVQELELPTAMNFEPELAWHPTEDRLAFSGTDLSTGEFVVGVADLDGGGISVLQRARGLGGRLVGWTPDGAHVVHTSRTYEASAGRYGHTFHRIAAGSDPDDSAESATWPVPDSLALRSGWTSDLTRVAYSVGGRAYWRVVAASGALPRPASRIADPAPRDFSWSNDGRLLLYRTGSRLRLLDTDRGTARDVPVDLRVATPVPPPPVLVAGARIIDGRGAPPTDPRDVLIENGRIAAIARPGDIDRPDARRVDASGMTLMPGLINLHVHAGLGQAWPAFPYFGTTTVRDAGTDAVWMRAETERIIGGVVGPRVFFAGGMIEHETGHGWMDRPAVDRRDTATVRDVISGLAELGAAVVKVRIPDPALDRLAARIAHDLDLRVTSHEVFPATIAEGLEGKEHAELYYRETLTTPYRADVLDLMAAAGTCVTTTLMAGGTLLWLLEGADPDHAFAPGTVDSMEPFVAPGMLQSLRRTLPPAAKARLREQFLTNLQNAARLHRAGGTLVAATDAGLLDARLDLELRLLVQGGFTPLEAIRAATFDAARCLGVEHELGTIEPGKLADLLLVANDPSADIAALSSIERVVMGGHVYDRDELGPDSAASASTPDVRNHAAVRSDLSESDANGVIQVVQQSGRVLLSVRPNGLGRPFFLQSFNAEPVAGVAWRNTPGPGAYFRLVDHDSVLTVEQLDFETTDPADPGVPVPTTVSVLPILRRERGTGSLVVDGSDLFLNPPRTHRWTVWGMEFGPFDPFASRLERVASSDVSFNVYVSHRFTIPRESGSTETRSIRVPIAYRALLLPRAPLQPRPCDPRIGVWHMPDPRASNEQGCMLVHRPLTAADPESAPSPPAEPIVFYIDPDTPERWVPWVARGVEMWKPVFRAAGWSDAIEARLPPSPGDDPDFDVYDLRHSVIYWDPWDDFAWGSHWSDPRSGEVLRGGVRIGGGYARSIHAKVWSETGAADDATRSLPVPDSLLGLELAGLVAHEVGHTLGLSHNMAASASVPVDSLRSRAFTCSEGLAPTVMDYTPHNYVAQPGDGACTRSRRMGFWDYEVIRWLYGRGDSSRAGVGTARTAVPSYRWSPTGTGVGGADPFDHRTTVYTLGDDPIRATEYGLANLRRLAEALPLLAGGDSAAARRAFPSADELFERLVLTWRRQLAHVTGLVGDATVTASRQRGALRFLLDHAFTPPAFLLTPRLAGVLHAPPSRAVGEAQRSLLAALLTDDRIARLDSLRAAATIDLGAAELLDALSRTLHSEPPATDAHPELRRALADFFQERLQQLRAPRGVRYRSGSDTQAYLTPIGI